MSGPRIQVPVTASRRSHDDNMVVKDLESTPPIAHNTSFRDANLRKASVGRHIRSSDPSGPAFAGSKCIAGVISTPPQPTDHPEAHRDQNEIAILSSGPPSPTRRPPRRGSSKTVTRRLHWTPPQHTIAAAGDIARSAARWARGGRRTPRRRQRWGHGWTRARRCGCWAVPAWAFIENDVAYLFFAAFKKPQ